ncbi:spore coat protein U domain-containing protein [Streptomyces sp. NPDC090025]|uniref:Csu type fimbrial protein n=1 Tax=Streptomyces sp. NPDC090025 TaxID=3365922 RepID=UPI0038386DCA
MITTEETGALARTLQDEGTGLRWTEAGAAEFAERLGRLADGRLAGRVRVSVDPAELVFPLSLPAPDPAAQAAEFRRVADAMRAALGEAAFLGTHGFAAPFGRTTDPRWGRPFLRWRMAETTLELRAGAEGPEAVLQPSAPWETWYQSVGRGFVGVRESSGLSLDHPRHEVPTDWDDLRLTLAAFLRTLPAVTTALGIPQNLPLYGRIPGTDTPLLFVLVSDARLFVEFTAYEIAEAARGAGAAALGWPPRPTAGLLPAELDGEAPWLLDAGGPGEVDAGAAADLIVRTARAAGVTRAADLILGGEAEFRHPFRFAFPGLALPVG